MDLTKITIITICYNSASTIESTIQSVLQQNYKNLEYIIVDGGSTDDTLKVVRKYYCNCMKIISEPDRGISDAFNKGIKRASGTLIGLINADDRLADNVLSRIDKVYQESLGDVIYGDTIVIDEANHLKLIKKAGSIERLKYEAPFIHQSCFISKRAYEIGGRYSEKYKICMDYDMLSRLYHKGCKFVYADIIISIFTYGGASCKHPLRTINENMRIAEKYGLEHRDALKYKTKLIFINISKIILSKMKLWNLLYRILKKDKIYTAD